MEQLRVLREMLVWWWKSSTTRAKLNDLEGPVIALFIAGLLIYTLARRTATDLFALGVAIIGILASLGTAATLFYLALRNANPGQ